MTYKLFFSLMAYILRNDGRPGTYDIWFIYCFNIYLLTYKLYSFQNSVQNYNKFLTYANIFEEKLTFRLFFYKYAPSDYHFMHI